MSNPDFERQVGIYTKLTNLNPMKRNNAQNRDSYNMKT